MCSLSTQAVFSGTCLQQVPRYKLLVWVEVIAIKMQIPTGGESSKPVQGG